VGVVTACLGGEPSRRRLSGRKEEAMLEKRSLSERLRTALVGAGERLRSLAEGREKLRKCAKKGVETADAGRLSSRRRVSTAGAEDPLRIVRLPERDGYRTPL
jgi:hypothetical protein